MAISKTNAMRLLNVKEMENPIMSYDNGEGKIHGLL